MTKKVTTSVIILTKNRAQLLRKNLSRLAKQKIKPSEIIIINNNSSDETPKVINEFKKILPIKSFKTGIRGYPKLYNLGIKKARGKLICFLDDDCFAKKDWLAELVKAHQKNPNSIIQGHTFSLPKDNIYAQIMGDHYQNWLKSNLINQKGLKVLDNKNALIPKNILAKYGAFSEKHSIGSEDLELGIRLRAQGIKIIFSPKVIAWHHERTTLKEFVGQHYRIAQSEAILDNSLPDNEKIGILAGKKAFMNILSGIKREFYYLKNFKLKESLLLPIIYLALIATRLGSYKYVNKK